MTTPKIKTVNRGGARHYIHPADPTATAVGVTSVLNGLAKPFLRYWASKVVAENAYDHADTLLTFVMAGQREEAVKWLKGTPNTFTGDAATRGTAVHEMTEAIDLAGALPPRMPKSSPLLPYARGYLAFREETEAVILDVERTIWSREFEYSGTLDRSLLIPESAFDGFVEPPAWYEGPDKRIIADVKTTKSGVHSEVALQLAAYSHAEEQLVPNEHGVYEAEPWPEHADTGLVIHLRPDAWRLVPVRCGPSEFEVFCMLRKLFTWDRSVKDTLVLPDVAGEAWDEGRLVVFSEMIDGLRGLGG